MKGMCREPRVRRGDRAKAAAETSRVMGKAAVSAGAQTGQRSGGPEAGASSERGGRSAPLGSTQGRPRGEPDSGERGSPLRGLRGAAPRLLVCLSRLNFLTAD